MVRFTWVSTEGADVPSLSVLPRTVRAGSRAGAQRPCAILKLVQCGLLLLPVAQPAPSAVLLAVLPPGACVWGPCHWPRGC